MANFDTIKTAIDANINTNGKQEITGGKMNSILKQMVDATGEQLTELESKAYINAKIFEGSGWGETLPYQMYPNYQYEITNIGSNPILAFSTYADANTPIPNDFPESLSAGQSVTITPSTDIALVRIYFNGLSTVLVRALVKVDEELLNIRNDYTEKIADVDSELKKAIQFESSPFSNADLMGKVDNFIPLAIKSCKIYTPKDKVKSIGINYMWKDVDGNWFIRFTADGEEIADWNKTNYTPQDSARDIIEIVQDNITITIIVNWDEVDVGGVWSQGLLEFREDCWNFVEYEESKPIKDSNGTMSTFIDGILDAKYFASNYQAMNNKFALTYFWKNYGDSKDCLIRVGQVSPNYKEPYAQLAFKDVADDIVEYTLDDGKIYFKIDWSKIPNGTVWNGTGEFETILLPTSDKPYDGYTTKDSTKRQVWVSQDGTQDYTSIGEAYAAITDSSYENQYEIIVLPGTYDEYNLIPPPFTHTYGLYPNTVKITSRNWANIGDTLPVFDQRTHPSKLSNLTIESWTGYCIHFDVAMNNVSIKNENLHLIKQHYDGAMMAIIGGGSYKYGARYEWKSCIFECVGAEGEASCHTQANSSGDNTFLLFDSCSFIKCSPYIGSVGAWGKCTCEITNCNFAFGQRGLGSWFSPIRSVDNPNEYLANRMEWSVIGGGNKNFAPSALNTISTIRIKADYPIEISGSAVDAIFGNNYKTNDHHSARIQCSVISMYYIDDSQAGLSGYSEIRDVYQLWKRLGDCSSVNKTLSVTINGVTKSYTFSKDYLSLKPSEDSIIADMQSALSHCTIEKYTNNDVGYDFINTTDKMYIEVADEDVIIGEFITKDGKRATSATNPSNIAGMVVADTTQGNLAPVWTSAINVGYMGYTGSGDIGLNDVGELYWTGKDKPIGFIKNKIFYPYY